MNGAVVKPMPMCLVRDDYLGFTRYSVTWCGLKFQAYTWLTCCKHIDDTTCEECRDNYAMGLLGELP